METSLNDLKSVFTILKKQFPSYEERPQQVEMAEAVLSCLRDNERLLVEAGTGVGKSFAYLIPAIISGEKTIVSTASIALQDQLINKDLIFLRSVMPQKFSFAMLKGKNNYLCMKREREFSEMSGPYMSFRRWLAETETGDRDELDFIPDFWTRVCGDSNDCGVSQCPFYTDCFYYMQYRNLYRKDIIVVNHHLLMYDLLSGFNILPFHKQLVIDEAHQTENIVSHVFGSVLSHSLVMWLLYRLRGLKIETSHLFDDVERFFKVSPQPYLQKNGDHIPGPLVEDLVKLKDKLALDKVTHRLSLVRDTAENEELHDRAETTMLYVRSLEGAIDDFIARDNKEKVYYMIENKKTIELRSSLVDCQSPFRELMNGYESIVMTSATLTTGGDFSYIKERLGISDIKDIVIGSPFDFREQALLYLDRQLPAPVRGNGDQFQQESIGTIEKLVNAAKGRALVLFTSYNHLRFAEKNIALDYPCKAQGDMSPARLIEWFRDTPHSVLLATATFWQGIDIKGEALSLVVIVKMPFGSPGDPVYDERCRRLGERWFSDLALPSAILQLRQGVGRLIRSAEDRGVVAVLDTRLLNSSYGKTIVSSLPDMKIVHTVEAVERFFGPVMPGNGRKKSIDNPYKKGYNVAPAGGRKVKGEKLGI